MSIASWSARARARSSSRSRAAAGSRALAGHAGVGRQLRRARPAHAARCGPRSGTATGAPSSRARPTAARPGQDAPQIKYPEGARYLAPPIPTEDDAAPGEGATLQATRRCSSSGCIAFGQPGRIYVGTIPGGLFTSNDGGESFELNRPLWNHESRGGDLFAGDGSGHDALVRHAGVRGRVRARHPLDRRRPAQPRAHARRGLDRRRARDHRRRQDLARPQQGHAQRLPAQPRRRVGPRSALRRAVPGPARPRLAAEPLRRLLQRRRRGDLEAR